MPYPANPASFAQSCDPSYTPDLHHVAIACAVAARLKRGGARIIINMPPRAGKSRLIAVETALWLMCAVSVEVVAATYALDLSLMHSREARARFDCEAFQAISSVRLSGDCAGADYWQLSNGSSYKAIGVDGGLTGFGAGLLILDDLHKDAAEAYSPTMRQRAWDWVQTVAMTRLAPNASVIMIGTRWHEDDVTGRMLAADPGRWMTFNIPAYAVENDPAARLPGQRLWPDRFSEEYYAERRNTLSKYFWAALYEGHPIPDTGGHVDINKFQIVDPSDVPTSGRFVRYWDLAVTKKQEADFTAGALCALDGSTLWIIDIASGQWEWPTSRGNIITHAQVDRCQVGIESVATGAGLVQNLREVFPPDLLLSETTPDKDKLTRALPWFAKVNAGDVRLVRGGWNNKFLGECQSFPNGTHDDMIDAVSGAADLLLTAQPGKIMPFTSTRAAQSFASRRERAIIA